MRYCPALLLSSACLLFAACGGGDEPPLVVNEKKFEETHPDNHVSGDVTTGEQTLTIAFDAPDAGYKVKIDSVWVVGEELWVIASLAHNGGMNAQMITPVSASVTVNAPKISPVYYVVGQPFSGLPSGNVKFIGSVADIQSGLDTGEQIWPKP